MKIGRSKRITTFHKFDCHCSYCGKRLEYYEMQVDHIIPTSKGGNSDIDNLAPTCACCNSQKRSKTIEEYRAYLTKTKTNRDGMPFFTSEQIKWLRNKHKINIEISLFEFYFEKNSKGESK